MQSKTFLLLSAIGLSSVAHAQKRTGACGEFDTLQTRCPIPASIQSAIATRADGAALDPKFETEMASCYCYDENLKWIATEVREVVQSCAAEHAAEGGDVNEAWLQENGNFCLTIGDVRAKATGGAGAATGTGEGAAEETGTGTAAAGSTGASSAEETGSNTESDASAPTGGSSSNSTGGTGANASSGGSLFNAQCGLVLGLAFLSGLLAL